MQKKGPTPEHAAAVAKDEAMHRATRGFLDQQRAQESDTEPDEDSLPAGSGPHGHGPPLSVGAHHRKRDLCDGAGSCSLGRWAPWHRPTFQPPPLARVRQLIVNYVEELKTRIGVTAEELFQQLARGQVDADPFARDSKRLRIVIDQVQAALTDGSGSAISQVGDVPQPVRIRMLQRILKLGGDPDAAGMEHFCRGVRIGVGTKMPRTPAVYARKRRWRLEGQGDPDFDVENERRARGSLEGQLPIGEDSRPGNFGAAGGRSGTPGGHQTH